MKILQVCNALACGGAESFVTNLCIEMSRHAEVHLFTYAGCIDNVGQAQMSKLVSRGIHVRSLNITTNWKKVVVPPMLARQILEIKPDIVNAHLGQSEIFCAAARFLTCHSAMACKLVGLYIVRAISP